MARVGETSNDYLLLPDPLKRRNAMHGMHYRQICIVAIYLAFEVRIARGRGGSNIQ